MRIHVFASGSGGNCLLLEDRETRILIDAGISKRRVVTTLAGLGLRMEQIGGVLITHEHSDHISGLESLVKGRTIPVCAPHTVAARLLGAKPSLQEHLQVIPVGEPFSLGSLRVTAFHTSHDTDESVGYRIEGEGVYAHATDTGCVTEGMRAGLLGADTVLLESNHDEVLLRTSQRPPALIQRILGPRGHLSNYQACDLVRRFAPTRLKRLALAHLSQDCNVPHVAANAMRDTLREMGRTDVALRILEQDEVVEL